MTVKNYETFKKFVEEVKTLDRSLTLSKIGKRRYNQLEEITLKVMSAKIIFPHIVKVLNKGKPVRLQNPLILKRALWVDIQLWTEEKLFDDSEMLQHFWAGVDIVTDFEDEFSDIFKPEFNEKIWDLIFSPHWEVLKFIFMGLAETLSEGVPNPIADLLKIFEEMETRLTDNSNKDDDDDYEYNEDDDKEMPFF